MEDWHQLFSANESLIGLFDNSCKQPKSVLAGALSHEGGSDCSQPCICGQGFLFFTFDVKI